MCGTHIKVIMHVMCVRLYGVHYFGAFFHISFVAFDVDRDKDEKVQEPTSQCKSERARAEGKETR